MSTVELFPSKTFGLGGVPLGNEFNKHTDAEAQATLEAAWDLGVRLLRVVAPWYGFGLAERRFGHFLHTSGKRDEYVLSSKVGKLFRASNRKTEARRDTFHSRIRRTIFVIDYTADGVRRSIEDSLQRLGIFASRRRLRPRSLARLLAWFPSD